MTLINFTIVVVILLFLAIGVKVVGYLEKRKSLKNKLTALVTLISGEKYKVIYEQTASYNVTDLTDKTIHRMLLINNKDMMFVQGDKILSVVVLNAVTK